MEGRNEELVDEEGWVEADGMEDNDSLISEGLFFAIETLGYKLIDELDKTPRVELDVDGMCVRVWFGSSEETGSHGVPRVPKRDQHEHYLFASESKLWPSDKLSGRLAEAPCKIEFETGWGHDDT